MILKTALSALATLSISPVAAQTADSPTPQAKLFAPTMSFARAITPPAVSVSVRDVIYGQAACNERAKTAMLIQGASNVGLSNGSTANWGEVGSNQLMIWCRNSQVFIVVAGSDQTTTNQFRDDLAYEFGNHMDFLDEADAAIKVVLKSMYETD